MNFIPPYYFELLVHLTHPIIANAIAFLIYPTAIVVYWADFLRQSLKEFVGHFYGHLYSKELKRSHI
jgi:hypothetical protein